MILSNSFGQIIGERARTLYCSSAMVSKTHALHEASSLAASLQSPVTILSNCLTLINVIATLKHCWPWECFELLGCIMHHILSWSEPEYLIQVYS
ncbi:hypothetical protein LINPERPRIM_LOCUS9670 [Linum perenne]